MSEAEGGVRLIVLRHGPAAIRDPARWPDDGLRPLSPDGIRQTRRVARGLSRLVDSVSGIATGPAVRARRTAEIVAAALEPRRRVEEWPELDVGNVAAPILARVRREVRPNACLVIVGHDPTLAELVGLALTGEDVALAHLTKGGAACLEFPVAIRPGSARLHWLLTRKQLAGAAD